MAIGISRAFTEEEDASEEAKDSRKKTQTQPATPPEWKIGRTSRVGKPPD